MLTKLNSLKLNKFRDDEEGFTLIELLVVILIIGVLAAVALPTFLNQGKKGADAAAKSDLRAVSTKVEACAANTNDYTKCITGATGAAASLDGDAATLPSLMTATVSSTGYVLTRSTDSKGTKQSFSLTNTNGNLGDITASAS